MLRVVTVAALVALPFGSVVWAACKPSARGNVHASLAACNARCDKGSEPAKCRAWCSANCSG